MKICFPACKGQRYYDLHFRYLLNIFAVLGWEVEYFEDDTGERGCLKMFVNGKEFMVDFSDYGHEYDGPLPTLRFHYKQEYAKPNIFPFSPYCFVNWAEYEERAKNFAYKAEGLVFHNQRPHCNNTERRDYVRRMVEDWCDRKRDAGIVLPKGLSCMGRELNGAHTVWDRSQRDYWDSLKDCLVSIHVPGQNNNMLDNAQLQLMGFGVCTISPELPEVLPWGRTLAPDYHYIRCADDYGDLKNKIDWCRSHKAECLKIGENAKIFFRQVCTPVPLGAWIEEVLKRIA